MICATSARFDICWFFSASPLIAETERPTSCRFWLRLLAVTMISSPEPAAGPSCPHAGTANAAETAHVTCAKDLTSLINLSLHFIVRSEEHPPELQSLMRISYAVFCLKQTNLD